jgi:predicted AAA+ superfamily ATPase
MEFARAAASRLRELASLFPVLVLTGARQSGKTTLLRACFPEHRYVSLDLPSLAEEAERNPEAFLAANPPPLLVDEVQYAPGLLRHLKSLVDRDRDAMGRIVLTGSQSFPLMKGVAESLAGRCVWQVLENLSLAEIAAGRKLEPGPADWPALVARGLFPELWKRPELPRREFLSSYVATYLERDVRQILNVGSLRNFERFLRLLALRSGNLLNKSDVARDTGISVKAAGDWLSVLEASSQIVLLEPWFENLGKRVVKTPKVYVQDPGLLSFLLGLDEASLGSSPLRGAVWESFVFAELRKRNEASRRPGKFWFFRDQGGREVDFLLERGGVLELIEAKWGEGPSEGEGLPIAAVAEALGRHSVTSRAGGRWIVSRTASPYPLPDGTRVVNPLGLGEIVDGGAGA